MIELKFTPHPDAKYKKDYVRIFRDIESGKLPQIPTFRALILEDLWFFVWAVMGIENANHPFVVAQCRAVEDGPTSDTLDVWARFHYKSVIITQAETIQYHLKNPSHCTGIFAYARPLAKAFLRSIKQMCEENEMLKACFPDVLYENPQRDSPKWSEDEGLCFKAHSPGRKESTIEAWGLVEGMPTGRHFERTVFDDIETDDIKDSPEMLDKVFSKFEMSYVNLGTGSDSDIRRVIGTYYSHCGPIVRIQNMALPTTGDLIFKARIVPGSDDGTASGKPVLMDEKTWEISKAGRHFNSQQLCNPTPDEDRDLESENFRPIDPELIPPDIFKFIVVDEAGDKKTRKNARDAWSILCFGVKPVANEVGASQVYLLDGAVRQFEHTAGINMVTQIYMRNGVISRIGVERTGLSTIDDYIKKSLAAHGRFVNEDSKTLQLLKPANRNKKEKIYKALHWPLNNSCLYYSTDCPKDVVDRIKTELDKHPFWHDDGIEGIAYLYDMLRDFTFPQHNHKVTPIRYNHRAIA